MMPTTTTTLLDLNQDLTLSHDDDQEHQQQQQQPSSLSFPILLNPLPHQKVEKIDDANCSSGSRDHSEKPNHGSGIIKLIWKNKKRDEAEAEEEEEEVIPKWMPSKMRMMRKMMVSDHHHQQQQEQEIPIIGTDDDNNNHNSNTTAPTVRVCSDCHTTKTPLWRSGPRGPKSLCNACGIRQRKARRAAMAAAAANGTTLAAAEVNKFGRSKEKQLKSKTGSSELMKKKRNKLGAAGRGKQSHHRHHHHQHDYCFEDLRLSLLSKNLAVHQVFPQDEKEAAILLMALSYGLLLG
ncbi:putative GATA transcription factor 22 [Arachis stenosperma]|uniref:putative GATA transcription factor 22 n=1 Tax=Arachis stenosperma TaxID=217475 RepID=UPI0025ABA485|nr:putative GATA transcription factor 22 [Arachis stenosperma]